MAETDSAVLKGDRLEWTGPAPDPAGRPVLVEVTFLISPGAGPADTDEDERRRRLVEPLKRIAARGDLSEIADAVAWQRGLRRDRPLPGFEP